MFLNFLHY